MKQVRHTALLRQAIDTQRRPLIAAVALTLSVVFALSASPAAAAACDSSIDPGCPDGTTVEHNIYTVGSGGSHTLFVRALNHDDSELWVASLGIFWKRKDGAFYGREKSASGAVDADWSSEWFYDGIMDSASSINARKTVWRERRTIEFHREDEFGATTMTCQVELGLLVRPRGFLESRTDQYKLLASEYTCS